MIFSKKSATFWDHALARSHEDDRTSLCKAAEAGIRSLDDEIGVQSAGCFDRLKDRDYPGWS